MSEQTAIETIETSKKTQIDGEKDAAACMVWVGQKCRRGSGEKNVMREGVLNIDVTSGSMKLLGSARVPAKILSPMTVGPMIDADGSVSQTVEGGWQGGKVYRSAGHMSAQRPEKPTEKWYALRAKMHAMVKGKRRSLPRKQYGVPCTAFYNGRWYGYVESRCEIYVHAYYHAIKNSPAIAEMRKMVADGQKIMIIDNDGPPRALYPNGLALDAESWRALILNPRYMFGHGYVVAALVAGLPESVILGVRAPTDAQSLCGKRQRHE